MAKLKGGSEFLKLKLKKVDFFGHQPPVPGYYWTERSTRDDILNSQGGNLLDIYKKVIWEWKVGLRAWIKWEDDEEDQQYYGFTWDDEPEVNEFGEVSP
jgi:hypothetical protein